MLYLKRLSSVIFLTTLLSGCGGTYKYDPTVSSDLQSLIEDDMSKLKDMKLTVRDAGDLKLLAMTDLSGPTIVKWLQQRTRIVVGEKYDWSGDNLVTSQRVSTPPALLSTAQTDFDSPVSLTTVMVNIGASIYLTGIDKQVVYTVRAAGKEVQVWSPRAAGMIQVGPGFLTPLTGSPLNSYANSIKRDSTAIHEATHTDGNGDHRAFAHAKCPTSYARAEFRGEYACENYLNGPYSRQVVFLRYAIAQACPVNGCTSAELDALMKAMSDYDLRKLPGAAYADPTPEGYAVSSISEISVTPQLSEMMLK